MTTIHLVDSNNSVRRKYETDNTGFALRNQFNAAFHTTDPMIFVFDGKNAKAARKAIYPDYKANRNKAPDEFYHTLGFFKELLHHTNKVILEIEGYEADDVIANLVWNNPTSKFLIHSNDGDFARLCSPLVSQTDPQLPKVPMHEVRLYKALVGDTSDNIKGIAKWGEKAWEKLTPEMKSHWEQSLEQGTIPQFELAGCSAKQYEWVQGNMKLLQSYWTIINFLHIPPELMVQNMKVGKPDYALANEKLKEIKQ